MAGAVTRARPAIATAPTWSRTKSSTRWSTAVTSDYARLSHRYYLLKAKWLGLEKLQHWDRNAPLPGGSGPSHNRGREARDQVLSAYASFSPELARIGQSVLRQCPGSTPRLRPGKSGGAFAHPTVPSVHPYLLVNFPWQNSRRYDAGT